MALELEAWFGGLFYDLCSAMCAPQASMVIVGAPPAPAASGAEEGQQDQVSGGQATGPASCKRNP